MIRRCSLPVALLAALMLPVTTAHADVVDLSGLGNGEKITGFDLSPLFSVSSSGDNLGIAIFDTSNPGPNDDGEDLDLLVNRGNALILQNTDFPGDSGGTDFWDTPNDDPDGGTMTFDFVSPVFMQSIDLIDINGGAATMVTLTDTNGLERVYEVPNEWTGEPGDNGSPGWETLDLTTLLDQDGPGTGGPATASEDAGFNQFAVNKVEIFFKGSAATNNFFFIPEPSSFGLLAAFGLSLYLRRRKR